MKKLLLFLFFLSFPLNSAYAEKIIYAELKNGQKIPLTVTSDLKLHLPKANDDQKTTHSFHINEDGEIHLFNHKGEEIKLLKQHLEKNNDELKKIIKKHSVAEVKASDKVKAAVVIDLMNILAQSEVSRITFTDNNAEEKESKPDEKE